MPRRFDPKRPYGTDAQRSTRDLRRELEEKRRNASYNVLAPHYSGPDAVQFEGAPHSPMFIDTVTKERARIAQLRNELKLRQELGQGRAVYGHAVPHADPSHHIGSCDSTCRAGHRAHYHRRP